MPSPWKNGGGVTREIVCQPPGAGAADFDWRVSIATIANDGPFSVFAGVDRVITLLDAEDGGTAQGIWLRSADATIDHRLENALEPFAFSGDVALDGLLLGAASTDFNLMVRRGRLRATLTIVDTAQSLPPSAQGLLFAARGRWQVRFGGADPQRELAQGDGLWWEGGTPDGDWPLAPLDDGAGQAALIVVQLWAADPG